MHHLTIMNVSCFHNLTWFPAICAFLLLFWLYAFWALREDKLPLVTLLHCPNSTLSQQLYSLRKANEVPVFGIYVGKLNVNKQEDLETKLH